MANTCTSQLCEVVVELMREGLTQDEVCAAVDKTAETFIEWRNPKGQYYEPEFEKAYRKGKTLQKAWWLRKGRTSLENKEFNTALFGLYMSNMFGWRSGASRDDEALQFGSLRNSWGWKIREHDNTRRIRPHSSAPAEAVPFR
jgi:hypothetical protein